MVIYLSLDKGTPIAVVEGGKYAGHLISIYDSDLKCCSKCDKTCEKKKCCEYCCFETPEKIEIDDPLDYLTENYLRKKKFRMTAKDVSLLKKALLKGIEPLEEDLSKIYKEIKTLYEKKKQNEFIIHDGKIRLLPNVNPFQNHRIFIAGSSGSGKSTWASNYIIDYKKIYPKNNFYVISNVKEDPVLDKLDPLRIQIDESILENPIEKEELSNSIILFDDFENFSDKKITTQIATMRDQLLQEGRKERIDILICSHHLTNYKSTRTTLNECQYIVFFPASNTYGVLYFLKNYVGLSKEQIKKIMSLPSRWVCVKKDYPQCVLYDSGIYLLK